MASSFDSFHLALQELQNDLDEFVEEEEEERASELSRLSSNIDVLSRDWRFLRMLWESIRGQRDSGDKQLVQLQQQHREDLEQEEGESESKSLALALRIEAAVEEILRDLVSLSEIKKRKKSCKDSESELLQLVVDCQTKTDQFITEIREVVDHHILRCSFQVHPSPPVDVYFWTSFVDSVMLNLWSVHSTLHLFDDDEVGQVSLVIDEKQVFASFKEL